MNEENQNKIMTVQEIPVTDIAPNPYQPRLEFDDMKLSSMADSISRYGVMQPIVVTKKPDGAYELISGERRLRASKIAGKETIPAVVRDYKHSDEEKFELAIIENIQREDLSPMDKAKAFEKLSNEFGYTHSEIAQKMGKSREYISNALRLLLLPDEILHAMGTDALTEGHARPLLMLKDRPYEQGELFKKIVSQKLTVRAAEKIARSIATEKLRKLDIEKSDPEIKVMEKTLAEKLGTKVHIDEKTVGEGGKLTIEYFSKEDLGKIINLVRGKGLSGAPVLESDSDNGIEKFTDNFANKESAEKNIGKEILKAAPASVFVDEINNLEKEVSPAMEQEKSVKIEISDADNANDIDGYNISFGAAPEKKPVEIIEKEPENIITENNFETNKDIDNFGTTDWRQEQKEENYQGDLENILKQRQNPSEQKAENIENNIQEKKHDITELHLDTEKIQNIPEVEEKIVSEEQPFSKDDFVMKSTEQKPQSTQPEISLHENLQGQNIVGKTAAQQRIDDILAGKKTVSEEYGIEESKNLLNNDPENLVKKAPEKTENIEDSSIYQQFLDSKKKIEDQKNRMFSGDNESAVDNIGSFSDETSDLTSNINVHTGNENTHVEMLNQERENKQALESIINTDSQNDNGAEVENIFGGSDFVPQKNDSQIVAEKKVLKSDQNNPWGAVDNERGEDFGEKKDNKYSFKGFSI